MTRASTSKRRRNSRPRAEEVTVEEEFRPSDSTRTKRVRSLTVRPVHPVHLSSESMTVPNPLSWKGGPAAILKPDFFRVDALDLAPRLLGKFLRRDDVVLRITEPDLMTQREAGTRLFLLLRLVLEFDHSDLRISKEMINTSQLTTQSKELGHMKFNCPKLKKRKEKEKATSVTEQGEKDHASTIALLLAKVNKLKENFKGKNSV